MSRVLSRYIRNTTEAFIISLVEQIGQRLASPLPSKSCLQGSEESNHLPALHPPQTSVLFLLSYFQIFSSFFTPTSFTLTSAQYLSGALCSVLAFQLSQSLTLHTATTSPSWAAKIPKGSFLPARIQTKLGFQASSCLSFLKSAHFRHLES